MLSRVRGQILNINAQAPDHFQKLIFKIMTLCHTIGKFIRFRSKPPIFHMVNQRFQILVKTLLNSF